MRFFVSGLSGSWPAGLYPCMGLPGLLRRVPKKPEFAAKIWLALVAAEFCSHFGTPSTQWEVTTDTREGLRDWGLRD